MILLLRGAKLRMYFRKSKNLTLQYVQYSCTQIFWFSSYIHQLSSSRDEVSWIMRARSSFHISHNALTYSDDLAKALSEICRVLRPGGIALVDIEWWAQGKDFETLRQLTLPEDTRMSLLSLDPKTSNIFLICSGATFSHKSGNFCSRFAE